MDNLSPSDRKRAMQRVRSKRTSLERKLWAMLAGMGLKGWRRNPQDIYGSPDVAFCENKIAIFADGCFWHGCPYCKKSMPVGNADYWLRKIQRNVNRASEVNHTLGDQGWTVIRVWEHEMKDAEIRRSVRGRIREAFAKGRDEGNR